jgi:hypothetical protein
MDIAGENAKPVAMEARRALSLSRPSLILTPAAPVAGPFARRKQK